MVCFNDVFSVIHEEEKPEAGELLVEVRNKYRALIGTEDFSMHSTVDDLLRMLT